MYRASCCFFIAIFTWLSLITFTEISTPGLPAGPTFPSRLHYDLWAHVPTAGSCHGRSPDVVLFTTAEVCDTVEEHLWVGLVLTGRLGQREHKVMLANYDKWRVRPGGSLCTRNSTRLKCAMKKRSWHSGTMVFFHSRHFIMGKAPVFLYNIN